MSLKKRKRASTVLSSDFMEEAKLIWCKNYDKKKIEHDGKP